MNSISEVRTPKNEIAEWAIAPARTVIGNGAVNHVGLMAHPLAAKAIVFGGARALDLAGDSVCSALRGSNVDCLDVVVFHGECCPATIKPIAARLAPGILAIAVGGGKVIDTVKAAAREAGTRLITVPTSPATCAAATALSVLHTAKGAYDFGKMYPPAPEATIIDLAILAACPPRLVASGLADAWARSLETDLASLVALPTGTSVFSLGIAQGYAERILIKEGRIVLDRGLDAGSDAFERVMSTCILGAGVASGLCTGFFLLNVAHSVAYGLTHLVDPHSALHGEMVALGLLVQALLEGPKEDRFDQTQEILESWDLPTRFEQIPGVSPNDSFLDQLAQLVSGSIDYEHAVPFAVSDMEIREALERVARD